MTPSQQRNLLLALLAAGVLIVVTASLIALTRSRRDIEIAAPADTAPASSGGFTFFDVRRTTVLDRDLRDRLSEALGSDAIAHATPIDLTIVDQAFMQAHLPEVYRLNQRLNPPLGERREHPTTRLTYLRAESRAMPFRSIELVFSNLNGRPLYFIIAPSEDFSDTIATLTAKYGPPHEIEAADRAAPVRIWEREGDYLVATRFRRRNGRPSQDLRIYFMENLRQLADSEAQARREQDRNTRKAGERAF
jgi:hypothetical protein